jgi:hypothetical protein
MIRGMHGLLYSSDADASRAFIRDTLRLPSTDTGGGWLIFDLPEGDLGIHPTDESGQPPPGTHDVSFYCDDIHGTVAELESRGVRFKSEVDDQGYGLVTYFTIPGGIEVQLYEPKYTKSTARPGSAKKVKARTVEARTAKVARAKPKRPAKRPVAKRRAKARR